MSGLEIIAAVSAVVSAFRSGSEIFKLVKKKRRAARKDQELAQQEWEEEQLQSSLLAGEKQISLRYERDQRELGDFIRIGDDVARERLYHIASMLQSEIIDTLNLAATNDFCTLNLCLLHEASITNRKDTLTALDELKQRIYLEFHTARQLKGVCEELRAWQSCPSSQIIHRNSYDAIRSAKNGFASSVASSPAHMGPRHVRKGSSESFQTSGRRNPSIDLQSAYTPTQAVGPNLSAALDELRPDHRASIIREIQHVINSYQDFNIDSEINPQNSHKNGHEHPVRRDTLVMLNDRALLDHNRRESYGNYYQALTPELAGHGIARSVSVPPISQDVCGLGKEHPSYNQPYDTPDSYFHLQAQRPPPRWSRGSVSSSAVSNAASLDRNSSNSSQESNAEVPPPPPRKSPRRRLTISVPNNTTDPQHDENRRTSLSSYSPHTAARDRYTSSPIKGLAHLCTHSNPSSTTPFRYDADANSLSPISMDLNPPAHMPWPGDEDSRDTSPSTQCAVPQLYTPPIEEEEENGDEEEELHTKKPTYHQHSLSVPTVQRTASTYSESVYSDTSEQKPPTPSSFSAYLAATSPFAPLKTIMGLRHANTSPSVTSTDSSNSFSIGILPGRRMRTSIIRSDSVAQTGGEKMLNGRPNKENDYWGFCKGAWAVREDPSKGIHVRTQPCGYYNSRQLFACKSCAFSGDVFKAPHPTKKGKTMDVVDPRIHTSKSGIRYRWIFLAKSHVKKKIADPKVHSWSEDNFGCIICCIEGHASSVYGGVETLMDHVAREHVADMSERTRGKVNCVLGRVAGEAEDWDINVPIFGSLE